MTPKADAIFDLVASKNECYEECARLRAEVERLTEQPDPFAALHAECLDALSASQRRVAELETALRIIAGYEQCADNLMSNVEIARSVLSRGQDRPEDRTVPDPVSEPTRVP